MEEINLGDSFLGFIPNMTEKRKVIDQRKAKSLERILNHSKYFQDNEDKLKAVYSKKEHIVRLMFTSDYVDVKQSPIFEVKERLKSSTTGKELQKPLSEYYIKGLVVSSTEFEFGQFLFEKFGKNTENQIALTAIISAARHENDQIKKIIVQKSERIQQENQKRYEEEKVIKAQAALEFEEALQKVGHTSDKKLEEKGKNTDMEKRTTDKMQSVTDEEITKALDESISGHGYWLVNHRDIIENIIANRIEIAGISQTIQEVGYSWLRSEENPYSDLELDMYEAIAKFNGDVDKDGRMTKKADIYKAINRRKRIKNEIEAGKIQKNEEKLEKVSKEINEYKHEIYFYDGTDEPQLVAKVKDDESLLDAPILGNPERRQARNYFLNPTPENLQDANINKFGIPKKEHLDMFTKKYREEHKGMEEKQDLDNKPLQSKDLAKQAIELIKEYKNNPNDVKEYLDFMSKFPELSPRNLALLEKQWPGANMVATYNQWAGKTSDSSKKMPEVFKVNSDDIEVITRTITDKKTGESKTITLDKLSVRQGEKSKISLLRGQEDRYFEKERDGKVQPHWEKFWSKEEKMKVEAGDIQAKSSMKYVPYKVFEISQTNIKPESLPKLMPNRHINFEADPKLIKSMTTGLEIYAKSIGVEVVKTTPGASSRTLGNAKGAATIDGKKITMNHLNTPSENVPTLIHELAHSTLHKRGSANQMSEQYAKQEFEAEMTSYVVSKRYGIDTSSQAISYIAGWTENMKKFSGAEGEKELSQSLSRIQKASHAMVKKIDAQINPVLKQTQKLQKQAVNKIQKSETLSKRNQPNLNIGR
ncbi:hypothetical protein LMK05_07230 [Lactococcus petauri]|nr:hypothetical protein LMK05_07230 [Lactococcus petauri]